jgi:hypothetical protein
VLESGVFDGLLGTERIDDRPALHVNDRVMAVLSNRCGGKSQHVPCFDLAHDLIERESGQMMALIDNYLAVICYEVLHFAFALETLNQRNVNLACSLFLSSANVPYSLYWQVEIKCQALAPLVK